MIIKRMTASFGKLSSEELRLTDGLNLICAPNESGKSTWASFLYAMFYGIDSTERVKTGYLPIKKKYQPWSGAPMSGTVELLWNDREITIERTSTARSPMSQFRAYETGSGVPVKELTADHCGEILLGVGASVFSRSAFIGQGGIAVSKDAALEQRLNALVQTGDETVSYIETEGCLRAWRNHIRSNRTTGLLPKLETELSELREKQAQIRNILRDDREASARQAQLSEEERRLRRVVNGQKKRRITEAETLVEQRRAERSTLLEAGVALPEEAALKSFGQELEQIAAAQRILLDTRPEAPEAEKATSSEKKSMRRSILFFILSVVFAVGGIFQPVAFILAGLAVFGAVVWFGKERNEMLLSRARAEHRAAEARRSAEQWAAYEARAQELQERMEALLRSIQTFDSTVSNLVDVRTAVTRALAIRRDFEHAEMAVLHAQAQLDAVREAVGTIDGELPLPGENTDEDAAGALLRITAERKLLDDTLSRHRGRLESFGDPAALEAGVEALLQKQTELTLRYDALSDALSALEEANRQLCTRFAPQIAACAGEYIRKLTGGRYDTILLDQELSVSAKSPEDLISRPILNLSCGTADQLYLAVRLAICRVTLNARTPLVLDDALINFDDARARAALRILRDEAETRQILLFSCHSREEALLRE